MSKTKKCTKCSKRKSLDKFYFCKLCVDHCHDTGKVRMLICRKCNTGIGQLGDNPELLKRAAKLLMNPPANKLKRG